ncbi:protein Njmu-R1-like isoform X2 [Babylonia areolata]|uniref:protein Njmu-R1-like isoform X2 n=1 Tax=Babylonia areolata TaxID=304850 RepID=UPI003FD1438E
MADESDSGSIHSSFSDQSVDKKSNDQKRFYALYTLYPNRPTSVGHAASVEENEQTEDGNLSLSIAATNLSASAETDLRKCLAQRLSRNSSSFNHGNVLSVGLSLTEDVTSSAACYYCVLENLPSSTHIDAAADRPPSLRKFVVCFISFFDSSLDLFRPDLDSYSSGLVHLLDHELSQLNTGVRGYLEGWHDTVLDYLTRCISCVGTQNVQYLLYTALVDATLQITGASTKEEDDIKRFVNCCTLSPLLEQLQTSDQQKGGIGSSGESWQVQPSVISLTVCEEGATFDLHGIETCQFCRKAADHLTSIDVKNVTKIRDSLESIRLAFIHNLNKLKRYLRQAELDHYALYRAFVFLKKCGCGNLLLRYVKLDASEDTLRVLTALETFLQSKGICFS